MVSGRKRLVALLLLIVLVANIRILSGCAEPPSDPPSDPPSGEPLTPDEIEDLAKYADFELSRAKLDAALDAALLKVDYAIETLDGKFPSNSSKNNVYSSMSWKSFKRFQSRFYPIGLFFSIVWR